MVAWNGVSWKRVKSANVGSRSNFLQAVTAASRTSLWAAGYYFNGHQEQTLIEHWTGHSWAITPSPNVGGGATTNGLYGIAAVSSTSAWAVGYHEPGQTLIEHWNGRTWKLVTSPNPGPVSDFLNGVAAASPSSVWAVGFDVTGPTGGRRGQTLVEHWNGHSWNRVKSPNVMGSNNNSLWAVAATGTTAWAVGIYVDDTAAKFPYQTLTARWTGHAWHFVPSPDR